MKMRNHFDCEWCVLSFMRQQLCHISNLLGVASPPCNSEPDGEFGSR